MSHTSKIKEYKQRRYQKYAEDYKGQKRRYYQENAELIRDGRKERRKAYPALFKGPDQVHSARRRAAKVQTQGSYTLQEWLALTKKYNFSCLCYGRREPEIQLTADHVVPLAKGGTNSIDNIQPLCVSCNSRKHTRIIDYREDRLNE